ncbi:hypothetical protein NEAUS06_0020 [Nematocida ausubeli]|nr:hypothetical protein NEAUS06_0020 [Nematocida ausubeli]
MDEISDDRAQRNRIDRLVEQIIVMEEEMHQIREENRVLKENIINSNKGISNEIIQTLGQQIASLRQEILSAAPVQGECSKCKEAVSALKTTTGDFKRLIYKLEEEISQVLSITYAQNSSLQEKTEQIELYAQINNKLTLIKEEYMRLKNL